MSWVVEFSWKGQPWERSQNSGRTYKGDTLYSHEFASFAEAAHEAREQERFSENSKYRAREVKVTMKIGTYEVTEVTRDTVQVGCQLVKRSEVEEVLKRMDEQPQLLNLHIGDHGQPGAVWLEARGPEGLILRMKSRSGGIYNILHLGQKGITRYSFCDSCGLPTEGGKSYVVLTTDEK